ncbi:MAG: glycoside hydrolase family 32 protein [Ilumatobacteraceae bacterium]
MTAAPGHGSGEPAAVRPVWHLTPPSGWMNDPNGLLRIDGRWHAFYQHHPYSDDWGPMHWGHASSTDGLRWHHHPIALRPDEHGTIFSGSMVVDRDGAAGAGAGAWVACFTHHAEDVQHQSIAWSTDGGETWTTHPANPVIPGTVRHFRDPKVRRLPDGRFHMVTTLGDRIACHRSDDLVRWEPAGTITAAVDGAGGMWECPDLVVGSDGSWWLVVSLSTGAADGHSNTVAMPLDGDGTTLAHAVADAVLSAGAPRPLDHGPDWYAAQSFTEHPPVAAGSVPVVMAWMNSWRYAALLPSAGWRGVQSLPRGVDLTRSGWVQRPAVRPVPNTGDGATRWVESDGDLVVRIEGHDGSATAGVRSGEAFVEREGLAVDGYAGRWSAPADGHGGHVVIVDHGSVEVFAAGGAATLSAQVFAGARPEVIVQNL